MDITLEAIPPTSAAEMLVADLLPLGASRSDAETARDAVPLWFHTFALAPDVYTPGVARDHGYRMSLFEGDRFAGRSVLDVGAFDGFYSFLAERSGASRVVAVDNEQYVDWVRARFGIELERAAGFTTISDLIGSEVAYHRMDAQDVGMLGERFDAVLCFGMLHRVTDPVSMLQVLADVLEPGGEVVLETYGSDLDPATPAIEVREPGDVYARDDFVYWGFTPASLQRLGRIVGLDHVEVLEVVRIDGHPRIVASLRKPG